MLPSNACPIEEYASCSWFKLGRMDLATGNLASNNYRSFSLLTPCLWEWCWNTIQAYLLHAEPGPMVSLLTADQLHIHHSNPFAHSKYEQEHFDWLIRSCNGEYASAIRSFSFLLRGLGTRLINAVYVGQQWLIVQLADGWGVLLLYSYNIEG